MSSLHAFADFIVVHVINLSTIYFLHGLRDAQFESQYIVYIVDYVGIV